MKKADLHHYALQFSIYLFHPLASWEITLLMRRIYVYFWYICQMRNEGKWKGCDNKLWMSYNDHSCAPVGDNLSHHNCLNCFKEVTPRNATANGAVSRCAKRRGGFFSYDQTLRSRIGEKIKKLWEILHVVNTILVAFSPQKSYLPLSLSLPWKT